MIKTNEDLFSFEYFSSFEDYVLFSYWF